MEKAEFEKFFKDNYTRLYYYALQLTGDSELSRDIVGEALEAAYASVSDIPAGSMLGYVYRLTHNKCVDHIRRESARARYVELSIYGYDDWNEVRETERVEEMERQINRVRGALGLLTPRTRTVLELHYFRGYTYEVTAKKLGISVSAVKKHIINALKVLRQELSKKCRE